MAASRRKLKRFQRQSAENTETFDRLAAMASQYGLRIDFAWQLPELFEQLLQNHAAAVSGGRPVGQIGPAAGAHRPPQDAMRRLAAGPVPAATVARPAQPGRPVAAPAGPRLALPVPIDDEEEVDPGLLEDLMDEFGGEVAEEEEDEPGQRPSVPSQAEMEAEYHRKLGGMFDRVERKGVKYGKGMTGPATGQRIGPHRTVDKKVIAAKSAPQAIDDSSLTELPGFEDMDLGAEEDVIDAENVEAAPAAPYDGKVDPKTGMSIGAKREIMSRVLGKPVKPPTPGQAARPIGPPIRSRG